MASENVQNVLPVPELTAVAVDYSRADEGFVADMIAPMIPVNKESFKYGVWGREELKDIDRTARAIGDAANTASKVSITYEDGAVSRYALKDSIPDEILNNVANRALYEAKRIKALVRKVRYGVEKRVHDLVTGTGNTASSLTGAWMTTATTTIDADVDSAKEQFFLKLGVEANKIIIPKLLATAIRRNTSIKDWVKYTDGADWLKTGELPSTLWGLDVIVPGGITDTAAPGAASASIARIWSAAADDAHAYLLYVDPESDVQTMTAMLQFRNTADAVPFAVKRWRDPDMSTNLSWYSTEVAQTEINVTPEAIMDLGDVH